MAGPIIKGITLTKWLHAPGGRKALNMRPLLIHKGLCCFLKLKFRRSFLVNQAAINIAIAKQLLWKEPMSVLTSWANFNFKIITKPACQTSSSSGAYFTRNSFFLLLTDPIHVYSRKHVNGDIFGDKMRREGLLLFYFEQVVSNQIQVNLSYFVKTQT